MWKPHARTNKGPRMSGSVGVGLKDLAGRHGLRAKALMPGIVRVAAKLRMIL
jgi:hypothetical protein